MAKRASNAVLDAALAKIATATTLVITSDEPINYAGVASVALADVTVTPGDGNGDFTIDDGDVSGRKLVIAAQEDFDVDATGTATHVCLHDGATLLFVTTCTSQSLTQGNKVSTPEWKIEFTDPT